MDDYSRRVPQYLIDEETIIENTTTEEVYPKILDWLKGKNAKVKAQNPPHLIKAVHGSWLWAGDPSAKARKNLEFVVTQNEGNVILRTMVSGPLHSYMADETKRQWLTLVEELWSELGVREKPAIVQQLNMPSRDVELVRRYHRNVLLGIGAGFLIFAGIIVLSQFYPNLTEYVDFIIYFPFLYALYGYLSTRNAKKRLTEARIEGVSAPSLFENRRHALFLVVSVLASVSVVGYIMAYPIQLTYSGYGFSFRYPPSMVVREYEYGGMRNSEFSGALILSNRDGESQEVVAWVTTDASRTAGMVVDEMISELRSNSNYTVVSLGEKAVVNYGFDIVTQKVSLKRLGKPIYIMNAAFYSSRGRMFMFTFVSSNSEYHCAHLFDQLASSFHEDFKSI